MKTETSSTLNQELQIAHENFDEYGRKANDIDRRRKDNDINGELIEELLSSLVMERNQVIEKRNREFELINELRLSLAANEEDIFIALSWMTEKGETIEHLKTVKGYLNNSERPNSTFLDQLALSAEDCILEYLWVCRVVCSQNDIEEFESDIYIVEAHPAFCVVALSEKTLQYLRQRFPLGKVCSSRNTIDSSEATMIKVVKVKTPISNSLKRRIQEIGAEIVEFLGRGGIIVSLPDMSIKEALMNIPEIKAVKDYTPKIDGNLQYLLLDNETPARHSDLDNITRQPVEISESGNVVFPGLLVAIFFTAADREAAAQQLQASHIEVVDQPRDDMLIIDLLDHPDWPQAFKMISNQRGLKAIEEERPATICVDRSAPLVAHGDVSIPLGPWNAAGEVIAIADTGLDTEHPDLIGQTLKVDNWADPPRNRGVEHTFDLDQSGHGTHVSGIAVGTGIKSKEFNQNPIQGIAAGAKLFFQKLECTIRIDDDEKTRLFIPKKIHEFLNAAYTSGARIHSNSWSHKQDYSDICFELDKFVWKHKDLLVVVAAGNQGRQEEHAPSHIAPSSITAPGTAKNCLTVGASENARCGEFTTTYGDMGFQHPPFNTQCIVDSINNIAAFSSRGPIEGQLPIDHEEYYLRYKPDVVAPGTFVLSTKSSQLTTNDLRAGSSVYPDAPEHYLYMSGTSMATPLVAGSAALVRQYLREKHSSPITSPSAALIKAIIIHSCQYLHYPYLHPASDRWVDNDQGWGRVNLVNIFNPEPPIQLSFEDQQQGMVTGEKYEYEITIADNSVPLKIMMVYTDFPGENLINNLNLTLRGPSGRYYVGNSFQEGGWLDDANNVEGIVVEQPETGIWQVAVIASEVIQETQDFALVASGGRLTLQRPVFYPNPSERQHLTA